MSFQLKEQIFLKAKGKNKGKNKVNLMSAYGVSIIPDVDVPDWTDLWSDPPMPNTRGDVWTL